MTKDLFYSLGWRTCSFSSAMAFKNSYWSDCALVCEAILCLNGLTSATFQSSHTMIATAKAINSCPLTCAGAVDSKLWPMACDRQRKEGESVEISAGLSSCSRVRVL